MYRFIEKYYFGAFNFRHGAQHGRAPHWGRGGRRFKSVIPTLYLLYKYYFDLFITSSAYQLISAIIPSKVLSSAPPS